MHPPRNPPSQPYTNTSDRSTQDVRPRFTLIAYDGGSSVLALSLALCASCNRTSMQAM